MIIALVLLGLGYINSAIINFPRHILSGIACYIMIVVIILNVFDKKKIRYLLFGLAILATIVCIFIKGGIGDSKFETYRNLDNLDIVLDGKIRVMSFAGTKDGSVEVVNTNEDIHTLILSGWNKGEYEFTISDENGHSYDFEYRFDKENNTVDLVLVK